MTQQIRRLGVVQTSKVIGMVYFLFTLVVCLPMCIIIASKMVMSGSTEQLSIIVLLVFAPIAYGVAAFLMGALACLVYNLVAKWVGGIEIEVE